MAERVVLVIPAWNEAEAIGAVLDEIPPGAVDQVLVVVGSHTDPTAAVARAHGATVLVPRRSGYGAACWSGARAALAGGADIIAFLDGDYSDPPAALERMLAPLRAGQADLVLGQRDLRRFPEAMPWHARAGNRLLLALLRRRLGTRLVDLPSFKVVRAAALRDMQMREMTYGWTIEMLVKAARAGLRIQVMSVEYRPRRGGRSKVTGSLRGSLGAAATLLGCTLAYLAWRPAADRRWSVTARGR